MGDDEDDGMSTPSIW